MDMLGLMMLSSPTFVDKTNYFPYQTIDTVFGSFNEGLQKLRRKLGEERYLKLKDLTDRMYAYFKADPKDETGEAQKGRLLIHEMEDLLLRKPPGSSAAWGCRTPACRGGPGSCARRGGGGCLEKTRWGSPR